MENTEELYTELNSDYDNLAKYIAKIARQIDKVNEKIKELDNDYQIQLNRLELYIKNEFWDKYSIKKHSFLMTTDKHFKFYTQKKMKSATAKYEAVQEENDVDDFDEEFNMLFSEDYGLDFEEEEAKKKQQFNEKVEFLEKELGRALFSVEVNSKQENTIGGIILQNEELEEKYRFAKEKLTNLQQEYDDCMNEIVSKLVDDTGYDFNIDTDEIMAVRDEDTMLWHLIYFNTEEITQAQLDLI